MNSAPPFGRLLRFWRQTFSMSQEALSLEVGVSARHISFLETGRSNPGLSLVSQIANVLGLSNRDKSNLLASAGFFPETPSDLSAPEQRWLRKSLALRLRDLEPVPAWVADPCGEILMVNRGWLYLNQEELQDTTQPMPMNAYHMYFSSRGIRRQILDWEDLACALLVNLQQEVLMTEDEAARQMLDELLSYQGIPKDWRLRGAGIPYAQSFKVQRQLPDGGIETFIAINTTLGATPYVPRPRLILSALHPLNRARWANSEDLSSLTHPKLYHDE